MELDCLMQSGISSQKPFQTFPKPCYYNGTFVRTRRKKKKKHFQSILSLPTNFHLSLHFRGGTFGQVKREWENSKGAHVQLLHTVPTWKCQRCGTLMDVAGAWFPGPIWTCVSPQCNHSMKRLMLLMVQEVTQRELCSPPALDSALDPLGHATMVQHYILFHM